MIAETRNIRTKASQEYIEQWFETDFRENLTDYLADVSPSSHEQYDLQVDTQVDTADLMYELSHAGEHTDLYVEVSGGELAVDSAINAFDELWTDSEFPERTEN
jgi:hypothetical protein